MKDLKEARFCQIEHAINENRKKAGYVKEISPKTLAEHLATLVSRGDLQHERREREGKMKPTGFYKTGTKFAIGLAMAELLWVLTKIEGKIFLINRRDAPKKQFADLPIPISFVERKDMEYLRDLMREASEWIDRNLAIQKSQELAGNRIS